MANFEESEEAERKSVAELVKSKESVLINEAKSKQSTITKADSIDKSMVETKSRSIVQSVVENKSRNVAEIKSRSITENKIQSDTKSHQRQVTESKLNFDANLLQAPDNTESPTSPLVEDGHIIYPGQTQQTRNRVQHYAQTLNAMLNRKSIVIEEDEEVVEDNAMNNRGGVQRSKSGTLLSVPKQYESAIKKSEVEEKARTVAAYFAGCKTAMSGQSIQRSSSQHSVLSSGSMKSFSRHDDKSSTVSPLQMDNVEQSTEFQRSNDVHSEHSGSTTTTTSMTTATSKSAHHLKILRKQQQKHSSPLAKSQTMPSINLLDETNVDDAFEEIFAAFGSK